MWITRLSGPLFRRTSRLASDPTKSSPDGTAAATERTSSRMCGAVVSATPRTRQGPEAFACRVWHRSVYAGTGSVGDSEGIHKILFAVEQGLKGQIMQDVMGHENQMASLYTPA